MDVMNAISSSSNDLELVERVFLMIVTAKTDEQYQASLRTFLTPTLLKFHNTTSQVKNKLIELLTHVNKRLLSRSKVLLPTQALIEQYLDENVPLSVKNFTIIYVKMGYLRENKELQLALLPQMFSCLSLNQVKNQTMILQAILLQLHCYHYPDDMTEKNKLLYFAYNSEIRKFVLEYFQDFLLLPYNVDFGNTENNPPPALSKAACLKFKMDPWLTKDDIELAKIGILKFLSLEVFPETDIIIPLIAGLGDARQSVTEKAEHAIKRVLSSHVLENYDVIAKMLFMYQGTPLQLQNKDILSDDVRMPASIHLKKKIFPFFLKSKLSADCKPLISLQIIFESLFGKETNLKIKHYTIDFIQHICIYGNKKTMEVLSALLYQALTKVAMNNKEENNLRSKAFAAFSALSKRSAVTFKNDPVLLQKLFVLLEEEVPEVRMAVQNAISCVAQTYTELSEVNLNVLQTLILNNLEKTLPQLRLASLQLTNTVFPTNHAMAKYICLLAVDDSINDIKDEALRGLRLAYPLPSYTDICTCLFEKMRERKIKNGQLVLSFTPIVYQKILWYIQQCFRCHANISDQDEFDGLSLKKSILFFNAYIEDYPYEDIWQSPIGWHISLIFDALNSSDSCLHIQAINSLLDLAAALPNKISGLLVDKLARIEEFVKSTKEEVRLLTAYLLSIIICTMIGDVVFEKLSHWMLSFHSNNFEEMHSAILCVALTLSRCKLCFNHKDKGKYCEYYGGAKFEKLVQKAIELLFSRLAGVNIGISSVCCFAIGEIAKYNKLPIPDMDCDGGVSKQKIIDELIKLFQDAPESKLKETAAIALGNICIGEPDIFYRHKVEDSLIESSKIKQPEIHFTIGQVLSCVGGGRFSILARDKYTLDEDYHKIPLPKTEYMTELIKKVNYECVYSHLAHVRHAAAIWLLSIVKFTPDHKGIEESILVIQTAFIELLSDAEEDIQDIASRGLGLIYDQVKSEYRNLLVSTLVEKLMSGKHLSKKVEKDTEIFKPGALGKTPDGSNLSTYKELCSLATSMNKPDLIYKFMSLASHDASWNSKKGAAFGFLSIASFAGEELKTYLPEIIPKLYRYQYDPNLAIQKTMSNIWAALVPDQKKTVEKYVNEIFDDILSNITSNLWRVRQSCCFALNDLIRACPAEDVVTRLPRLWKLLFNVMDDIKESVRNAAAVFGKALSRVSIHLCDINYSKLGERAVEDVLPVLLDIGLSSRVDEVKALSLKTLVQVTKNAGVLLKPHVSKFIISLLESLSALEPEYLNTLNLQLSQNEEAQEKLDIVRLSASKTSPMMEAVNFSSQYIDETILADLVPRLCDLLKTGLGLGTKVGCTTLLNSLMMQYKALLTPYAGKLLASLLNGLLDYNIALKKAYASCIGHLIQYVKEATMSKLFDKLRKWYFEKEDYSIHFSCALTLNAMSKYSYDTFYQYHGIALPLVFIAKQHGYSDKLSPAEECMQEIWDEIWNNNTSGNIPAIKLYLKEIFDMISPLLINQSWTLRTKAAKSIITIAESLGSSLPHSYLQNFIQVLLDSLRGRTWPGKEFLLKALSTMVIKCRSGMIDSKTNNEIFSRMIQECKKENLDYKLSAVECFTSVVIEWEIDMFEEFKPVLESLFEQTCTDDEDKVFEKKDTLLVAAYESLGRMWPYKAGSQKRHIDYAILLFEIHLNSSTWKIQKALLNASTSFVKRIVWNEACLNWHDEYGKSIVAKFLHFFINEVFKCMESTTYSSVKLQGLMFFFGLYSSAEVCVELYNMIKPFEGQLVLITVSCKDSTNFDITTNALELLKIISLVSKTHLLCEEKI